eukprot:TRINITY_DN13453_c0_g1_i1.p1 TRINITY_DN13453_c0_g1~~TRINITY_DN13453_c0_g1_i1.p1  ORF type:complete len:909 (-),score=146.82 TRINITY_DN13453_c0_g1_i1:309-3035(-)
MDNGVGHYGQLGISRTANLKAICAAYRRRALQTHPDKGGSHNEYLSVREAFEVLSDPRLRAEYDQAIQSSSARDGEPSGIPSAGPTSGNHDVGGSEKGFSTCSATASKAPLMLAGDTPWQEAARMLVNMMDLPETSWVSEVERHSQEVLERACEQLHKSREAPNVRGKAAKEADEHTGTRISIRGLYETKKGHWEVCLSIRKVQCAIFNVKDIGKAHDWHVALVELRRTVEGKVQDGMSERAAFREAVDEVYEAEPELRLVLSFRVNIRESQKVINGPFTHRLETALQLRNRVQQLRDMHAGSQDVDREIRDAKLYEKKQRDLQKARQVAMLHEIRTVLDQIQRQLAAKLKKSQPVLALPPPEPSGASLRALEQPQATVPDPPTQEATQDASTPCDEGDQQCQTDPCSVPLKGFAKFCRSMGFSKQQRDQLLSQVQQDHAVQNAISEAIARHAVNIRSTKKCLADAVRKPTTTKRSPAAITAEAHTGTTDSSLALVPVEPARKADPSCTLTGIVQRRLRILTETGQACDARRKWLLELLLEKHEAVYHPGLLSLCDFLRVAMVSQRVWKASAGATKCKFSNFRLADFGLVTSRSKRGRALPGGQLRMLRECLRTRRFAVHVRHLDISTLEMAPISKEEFQYMLGCLPNLSSITLPSKGWAGNLQLKNFVNIAKSLKVGIGASSEADVILRNVTGGSRPLPLAPQTNPRPTAAVQQPQDPRFMLQLRSARKRCRSDKEPIGRAKNLGQSLSDAEMRAAGSEALGLRSLAGGLPQKPGLDTHSFQSAAMPPPTVKRPRSEPQRTPALKQPEALPLQWQAPSVPSRYTAPELGQQRALEGRAPSPFDMPMTPEPESFCPVAPAVSLLQKKGNLLRRRSGGEYQKPSLGGELPNQGSQAGHSFWFLPGRRPL